MALEFRFPDVGEGIHEGEIVRWLVQEGDHVRPDQPLVEVETDKAVVEIPAPRAGTILHMACLLYTSPSPRDGLLSRMPSSA